MSLIEVLHIRQRATLSTDLTEAVSSFFGTYRRQFVPSVFPFRRFGWPFQRAQARFFEFRILRVPILRVLSASPPGLKTIFGNILFSNPHISC